MNNQELKSEKPLKTWISLTGYRILLILNSLIESGRTLEELINILKTDKITGKSCSKDTVRMVISTLKYAGCKISRPAKSNGYKYELLEHPFCFKLTQDEWNILIHLRERFTETLNCDDIFTVNDLYNKIMSLTCNDEYITKTKESQPLGQVDKQVLQDILNPSLIGKKLNITYNSPEFGFESINVVPEKITIENSKIYMWCFNLKYRKNSLLSVDRIKKINSVDIFQDEVVKTDVYEVIYELYDSKSKGFELKENEEIIDNYDDITLIKAKVDNEFLFIQRLLLFGNDFKIISPDFFREKLINKIKLIQKGYEQ